MADLIDMAMENDFSEERLRAQLAQAKSAQPIARGTCLYCTSKIVGLFCDDDCKSDWEEEQVIRKRTGRK